MKRRTKKGMRPGIPFCIALICDRARNFRNQLFHGLRRDETTNLRSDGRIRFCEYHHDQQDDNRHRQSDKNRMQTERVA